MFRQAALLMACACALPFAAAVEEDMPPRPPRPSAEAVRAIRPHEPVEKVFLGVVPDSTATIVDGPDGVVVKSVEPGSMAEDLGIEPGDVITHWGDTAVVTVADLKQAINSSEIGEEVTLVLVRDGSVIEASGLTRGKLRPEEIADLAEKTGELQSMIREAGGSKDSLARSLRYLSIALNELPERIEEAATQFKRIYPQGEFRINIEIVIDSNVNEDDPILRLDYGAEPDQPIPDEADEAMDEEQP